MKIPPPPEEKCAICGGKFVKKDRLLYHMRLGVYFHQQHDIFENKVEGEWIDGHALMGCVL